jgi:hypothetical protein
VPAVAPDPLREFFDLPKRLFLDSSALQAILRHGEFIWENVTPEPSEHLYRSFVRFFDELDALRHILQLNQRASFDIVVSEASLCEVAAKGEPSYTRYAEAVRAHWLGRINEQQSRAFKGDGEERAAQLDRRAVGYLSIKDKALLLDALALECQAFLTLDAKLAKNARHIEAVGGIRVLRPSDYWTLLRPWAALWL